MDGEIEVYCGELVCYCPGDMCTSVHLISTSCQILTPVYYFMFLISTPFVEYESVSGVTSVSSRKEHTVSVAGVYKKIAEYSGDIPFPLSETEVTHNNTIRSQEGAFDAASSFISPEKKQSSTRCATPQSRVKFESVLGSPLRGGARRVAVSAAFSPLRGMSATPSRKNHKLPVTATPAVSDAVVSAAARATIIGLLRPVSSQRTTAQELLTGTWLSSED